MHLVKFCEYRYQELSLKSQEDKIYDCNTDMETKAVHEVLNAYRNALKSAMVVKALVDYVLVQLGKKEAPKPAFEERVKELKAAEAKAKEEMLAKTECSTESVVSEA